MSCVFASGAVAAVYDTSIYKPISLFPASRRMFYTVSHGKVLCFSIFSNTPFRYPTTNKFPSTSRQQYVFTISSARYFCAAAAAGQPTPDSFPVVCSAADTPPHCSRRHHCSRYLEPHRRTNCPHLSGYEHANTRPRWKSALGE